MSTTEQQLDAIARRLRTNGAEVDDAPFAIDSVPESTSTDERPLVEFIDHDDLFAPEPKASLLVPDLGLAPGPPIGVFGESYVGKSIVTMAGGMSVALGRDFWGLYRVRAGLWVHLDYEQGRRRTKTLVQRLTAGFGATKEDIRGKLRVAVYPSLNLTTTGAVDHFARAFDGAAVVTADALKGLTPGVDENSSAMRDYMGALRIASEKTGATVLLNHNAGKPSPEKSRARKYAGRGSFAIFEECSSVFVLSAEKGEHTFVTHEKDRELGMLVADFDLRIEDVPTGDGNPRGGLRVVHMDREQLTTPEATSIPLRADSKFEKLKADILAIVQQRQDLTSRNAICARVSGAGKDVKLEAIAELLTAGRLAQPGGERSPFRVL
jgi:hypothetical protein